jgi:hypothetical protein
MHSGSFPQIAGSQGLFVLVSLPVGLCTVRYSWLDSSGDSRESLGPERQLSSNPHFFDFLPIFEEFAIDGVAVPQLIFQVWPALP